MATTLTNARLRLGYKGPVVEVRKHGHDHLAVEAVRHAAVARDGVAKVLHFEGALEAARKEAT